MDKLCYIYMYIYVFVDSIPITAQTTLLGTLNVDLSVQGLLFSSNQ